MSQWTAPSARDRWDIIRRTKSVAMVGASANPARPSYRMMPGDWLTGAGHFTSGFPPTGSPPDVQLTG